MRVIIAIVALTVAIAVFALFNKNLPKNDGEFQPRTKAEISASKNLPETKNDDCDQFWEAQNQTLEKAKTEKSENRELFLYLKSMAIGNAYQNCLARNQNGGER